MSGNACPIDALIARDNLHHRQIYRLRLLAFLAPDIVDRIITRNITETRTLKRLKKDFSTEWKAQRSHFGLSQVTH